jgi:hypothetical protein
MKKRQASSPLQDILFNKNGRGITQRRVNLCSHDCDGIQRGQSISAYMGNIVVQSNLKQDHTEDLCRAFSKLYNAGLKLNLEKCILE